LPDEYSNFYNGYISLVNDGDYFTMLDENSAEVVQLFGGLSEEMQNARYATGKWSLKQMLMHMTDTERVMGYRALVIARGDLSSQLPSMDQDLFAAGVNVEERDLQDILEEFTIVRQSSKKLLANINETQSVFRGNVFGNPLTPRALAYIILGHSMHHLKIAREKYLGF
jgi:hypothetical protein